MAIVVGIGAARSGSTTLSVCLDTLGYRVNNGSPHLRGLLRNGRTGKLLSILRGYDAACDSPWNWMYPEIDQAMGKDCLFVLTTRHTLALHAASIWVYRCTYNRKYRHLRGKLPDDIFLKSTVSELRRWNAARRRYFEGQPNFLEVCWGKGDGWKELCRFLGKKPREMPFPKANRGNYRSGQRVAIIARARELGIDD